MACILAPLELPSSCYSPARPGLSGHAENITLVPLITDIVLFRMCEQGMVKTREPYFLTLPQWAKWLEPGEGGKAPHLLLPDWCSLSFLCVVFGWSRVIIV